ncbi:uncharacterized protein [Anolis sagrei]|uniref:uncharacterized protein isoform X2 n=1 Tax=Anolis sagrei TaxID=38937 RepID=UPI00351F811F
MAEEEKQTPDTLGPLANSSVSFEGRKEAEGDPREEAPQDDLGEPVRPASGDPPPAKESGSRTNSDVDGMSNDAIIEQLDCIFKNVSKFTDPAAKEFLKARVREVEAFACLLQENELLQAQKSKEVAQLQAENERLQQELEEAKRSQKTDFHIQVLVTGKTGGCEKQFIKKVSDHLSDHHINLKPERYREGSGHFLLVFCLGASSVGSELANALKGLGSKPKAILVMLHHKLKESTSPVDTKKQADHPAVVRTLHARYTLESGFYTCPMNEEAVAAVAEVLKDHC